MYNGFIKSNININNATMVCYEKGKGDTTCILSCGWAVPFPFSDMFELADTLSKTYRCVVFDRFGYGFSDSSNDRRGFSAITKETKLLCEELHISGNVIYIGHSLSTFHALDFAKTFPDMIKGLVLIDGYYFDSFLGRMLFGINWMSAYYFLLLKKLGLIDKIEDEKLKKALLGDRVIPDEILKDTLDISRKRLYNKTILSELSASIRDLKSLNSGLDALDFPVVAICRNITYKNNFKKHAFLRKLSVINVGKSSHFIHYEYPEKIVDEVNKILIFSSSNQV